MKKIYILPNLVTTANLVCGILSMVHAFQGDYFRSAWYVVIGAICDSLDGRIARFARATSAFGVQYDSLSDLTSFGIAPAMLLFSYGAKSTPLGISAAALYAVCAALRLARFNVSAEEKDPSKLAKIRKGYFQGLPSPASAGLIVTTVLIQEKFTWFPVDALPGVMCALGLVFGLLMVSNVPFPSFKEVNWRSKGKAWILILPVVFILCVIQAPEPTLFACGYLYFFASLAWSVYLRFFRGPAIGGEA
jgi:CDP-diacylglycerol--serine O-phosphatidyltransferase